MWGQRIDVARWTQLRVYICVCADNDYIVQLSSRYMILSINQILFISIHWSTMNNVEPTVDGIECSPCSKYKRCRYMLIWINYYSDRLLHCRSTLRSVIEGQLLSICLCGAGVSSQLLSTYGINTPSGNYNLINDWLFNLQLKTLSTISFLHLCTVFIYRVK
jgi:hypothetical protein